MNRVGRELNETRDRVDADRFTAVQHPSQIIA